MMELVAKSRAESIRHMSNHAHAIAHARKYKRQQQPSYVAIFVALHLSDAKAISARTGIPAEVILAQSALESNWGRTVKDNAFFGIKGKAPTGKSTSFATHEVTLAGKTLSEVDEFRAYGERLRLTDTAQIQGRARLS